MLSLSAHTFNLSEPCWFRYRSVFSTDGSTTAFQTQLKFSSLQVQLKHALERYFVCFLFCHFHSQPDLIVTLPPTVLKWQSKFSLIIAIFASTNLKLKLPHLFDKSFEESCRNISHASCVWKICRYVVLKSIWELSSVLLVRSAKWKSRKELRHSNLLDMGLWVSQIIEMLNMPWFHFKAEWCLDEAWSKNYMYCFKEWKWLHLTLFPLLSLRVIVEAIWCWLIIISSTQNQLGRQRVHPQESTQHN